MGETDKTAVMPAGGAPSAAADDPVVVVVVSGRKRRRKQQAAAASAAAERRLRSRPTHRLSAHSSPLRADTAAATAAACATLRFRIGDSVVIGGLQRAPQYNDLEGVVVASPPGAPGCGVRCPRYVTPSWWTGNRRAHRRVYRLRPEAYSFVGRRLYLHRGCPGGVSCKSGGS